MAAQPERTAYTVEGRIESSDIWLAGRDYVVAILDVDRAERGGVAVDVAGRILLRWSAPEFAVHTGDRVRVRGVPDLAIAHVNPGTGGPEDHYRRRGVHTAMRVRGDGVEVLSTAVWYDVWGALSRFRGELAARLGRAIPAGSLPLVLTVWLGDRRQIDTDQYVDFVESGTAHILSVSGLHVAILFASLRVLLRMGIRRPRVRLTVSLLSLLAVVGLTGGSVATLRATLMIAIYLAAEWFEREPDAPTALGVAAAIFLVQDPDMLYDTGFQLSFLSVASLLLFDQAIMDALGPVPYTLRGAVSATLAVQVLPLPVAAHAFHVLPLAAPFANLLVIPLTGVVLWLAFMTSVTAFILPPVAALFGYALHPVAQSILWLASFVSDWDRSRVQLTSPTALAIAAYSLAAVAAYAASRMPPGRRAAWAGMALALLAASAILWAPIRPAAEVTVLDVGHGDAIFVRAPGGATMLVDAGQRSEYVDEGERAVAPFLWSNHETTLDVLMLTHPDSDHMGGSRYILERFRVGTVVLGPRPFAGSMEDELLEVCARRGVPVQRLERGDRFTLGGARVEILHPPRDIAAGIGENDRSLVARVSWPGMSVLLTGDIEAAGERMLAAEPVQADVIKAPHHGSITSSSEPFIDAVNARIAVVSVGPRGRQHVLSPEVVRRYESRGVRVFRTDVVGGVRLRPARGGGIRVEAARPARGYVTR